MISASMIASSGKVMLLCSRAAWHGVSGAVTVRQAVELWAMHWSETSCVMKGPMHWGEMLCTMKGPMHWGKT